MTTPFTTKDAFDSAEEFEEETKEPSWIKIRLNNIGYKCAEDSLVGQFVYYYKNCDYNTLQAKLNSGWKDNGDFISNENYNISKSLVNESLPECQYVIAWLRYDADEVCCDLETVGSRLLDISPAEREDFFQIYSIADMKMRLNYEREF